MTKLKMIILIKRATPADPKIPSEPKDGYIIQGKPSMTNTIPYSQEQAVFARHE